MAMNEHELRTLVEQGMAVNLVGGKFLLYNSAEGKG